jgi:tetratricopeptide (TPR) repeat protein
MALVVGPNGEWPCLDQTTVGSALESLRLGKDLPMNHPLTQFVSVHPLGSAFSAEARPAVQTRIFNHLTETILSHLNHVRRMANLAPTSGDEKDTGIALDFQQDNEDLHAWSYLYHRYVRVDLGISLKDIQDLASQAQRTLYRRQELGLFRLAHELNSREMRVRAMQQTALLRQKLPAPDSPFFVAREGELDWALRALSSARRVLVTGMSGIGKTALARQLSLRLIEQLAVTSVAWISEPSGLLAKLWEQLAEALGMPVAAAHAETLQAYLAQVDCLIVLDQADLLVGNPDVVGSLLTTLGRALLILCSQRVPPALPAIPTLGLQELTRHDFDVLVEQYAEHYPQLFPKLERLDDFYAQAGGNPGALSDALAPGRSHSAMEVSEGRLSALWKTLPAEAQVAWLILAIYAESPILHSHLSLILQIEEPLPHVEASGGEQGLMALWQRAVVRLEPAGDDSAVVLSRLARTFAEGLIATAAPDQTALVYQAIRHIAAHLAAYPDAVACARMLRAAARADLHATLRLNLAYGSMTLVERTGQWDAWSSYLLGLLDVAEGADRVWALTHLAVASRHLVRGDEAAYYFIDAIETAGTLGEFTAQAEAQLELAVLFSHRRNVSAATFLLDAAEAIFRRYGMTAHVERVALERAQLYAQPQPVRPVEAESSFAMYLAIQSAFDTGDFDAALRMAEDLHGALSVDDPNYPRVVALFGQVQYEMGEWVGAAEKLQWAIQVLDAAQDVEGVTRLKYNLAMLYLRQGDPQAALALLETLPPDFT